MIIEVRTKIASGSCMCDVDYRRNGFRDSDLREL